MAASSESTRRWVATLIVLLLALQAGRWLWRKYHAAQLTPPEVAEQLLQRKIAASHAYDNALLRANTLLNQQNTTAASRLLDSLRRTPADSLFGIERQKLQATLLRLDSARAAQQTQHP